MLRNFSLIILLIILPLVSCRAVVVDDVIISTSDTLRFATYNIRINISSDDGARSWNQRREHVAALIHKYRFDVFGVQELINQAQENELQSMLPSFANSSRGRDNQTGSTGERLAIFYNKQRFELLDEGFFFLSETPDQVSKGWDAALNRICQWVKLHDKITTQDFYFFNTHFDHVGVNARAQSAVLINAKIAQIVQGGLAVCVGDFNASPSETVVYNSMMVKFKDARSVAQLIEGTPGTYNGWGVNLSTFNENVRIDYIYCPETFPVFEYRVINDQFVPEAFPSDHFPVMIQCKLNH